MNKSLPTYGLGVSSKDGREVALLVATAEQRSFSVGAIVVTLPLVN